MKNLTIPQKKAIDEIDQIVNLLGLNYKDIDKFESVGRIPVLKKIKDQLIRSEVLYRYNLTDEYLNLIICNYFFGNKSFIKLWKTKKFQNFNFFILEKMSLMEKIKLARSIKDIPKKIYRNIERLNDLRNGLAHSLFPENRKENKPFYKGKDIFSVGGIDVFIADMEAINKFFLKICFNTMY